MKFFESLLAASALASGVAALPSMYPPTSPASRSPLLDKRQSTPNGEGTHNGYFYRYIYIQDIFIT
jgi:hypothetical protein